MSTLNLDSPFVSYSLTPEELLMGQLLQENQKQVIQNLLFTAAVEKMNLPWTPDNLQTEAELQGKIRAYQSILIAHEEATKEISDRQNTYEGRSDLDNQMQQDYQNIFQSRD